MKKKYNKKNEWDKIRDELPGVYLIKSRKKPQRMYVGSSRKIGKRWTEHLILLRRNKHYNRELQDHYNSYGEIDLQFSIIVGCDKNYLKEYEQFFIDVFKPYFNFQKSTGAGYHE